MDNLDRVAFAIFDAHRNFHTVEGEPPVSDRHFKVAISMYRAMATAAISAMDGRQDISTAPLDGTEIDLFLEGGERVTDAWFQAGRWVHWWIGDFDSMDAVKVSGTPTHWMPKPLPPTPPQHGGE